MNRGQLKALWFLFTVVSGCVVLAGCKQTPSEGRSESPGAVEPSNNVQADTGPESLQAGQSAVCENLEVTPLSLKRASEYTRNPREGQGYAVLRYRVRNMGQDEESGLLGSSLCFRDAESGVRQSAERTTGVKVEYPESYKVAPGASREFEDVYMMPTDLSEAEFHYVKGYNPKELARWIMTIE